MEIYRNFISKTSRGDAYDDLDDTEVKQGCRRRVDLITCENEDHAYTELRIGILRYGVEYWLEGEKSPSAATLYWMDEPVHLAEDETLRCRFTGCTDGDVLRVTLIGEWEKADPPVPARAPARASTPSERPVVRARPKRAWEAVG